MKLIINGDDIGYSESCSNAIAEALRKHLITHTTMMANGESFETAVALAKQFHLESKVGIHFNLTEGKPLTAAITACAAFTANGRFHKQYLRCPRQLKKAEQEAVFEELSAQAERMLAAGFAVAHADSHHYIHSFLFLAPIAAQVCRAYGIRRVRLNRTFDTAKHPRVTEGRMDNAWWREQGFVTTAHFGRLADMAQPLLENTEIMVHPDFDKNGVLIDREGYADSFPEGTPLAVIKKYLSQA